MREEKSTNLVVSSLVASCSTSGEQIKGRSGGKKWDGGRRQKRYRQQKRTQKVGRQQRKRTQEVGRQNRPKGIGQQRKTEEGDCRQRELLGDFQRGGRLILRKGAGLRRRRRNPCLNINTLTILTILAILTVLNILNLCQNTDVLLLLVQRQHKRTSTQVLQTHKELHNKYACRSSINFLCLVIITDKSVDMCLNNTDNVWCHYQNRHVQNSHQSL